MADIKEAFGASTAVVITLAGLVQAGARECTAIDNGTNKFLDAMVYLALKLQAGATGSDQVINVYFYGSEDGTNFTDNATGADAAVTLRSPTNLRGPFVIATPDAGALTYKGVIGSVAAFFGGVLPRKWGFVVENRTNVTFDAAEGNHVKTYTGVYATNV